VEFLSAGSFDKAAALVASLRGEHDLASQLNAFVIVIAQAASPGALASIRVEQEVAALAAAGTRAIAAAARQGVSAALARRLDEHGPLERANGRLAGHYWLLARRPADALASVARTLAAAPLLADALIIEGNAHLASGRRERARECFWRALRASPAEVALADIADEEVRALAYDAAELGLSPPEPWLPFVGLLEGIFHLSPESFAREPTPADLFSAALVRSRTATLRGTADIEARREMKRIAPGLFARLLEQGLI
jgi:tetratricopeptide (TPR) repeat protein